MTKKERYRKQAVAEVDAQVAQAVDAVAGLGRIHPIIGIDQDGDGQALARLILAAGKRLVAGADQPGRRQHIEIVMDDMESMLHGDITTQASVEEMMVKLTSLSAASKQPKPKTR